MLRPSKPKEWANEVCWDIETTAWTNVVAVCGVDRYGEVVRAKGFIDYLRQAEKLGWLKGNVRHWAHWGGIFDHLHACDALLGDWIVEDAKGGSGFGLWSLDLRRGPFWWRLRDSSRIFPMSLAEVGKAFGVLKKEVDRENIGLLSESELLDYCVQDCVVLANAIRRFDEFMRENGGFGLSDTIAATASNAVRRTLPADLFGWEHCQDTAVSAAYYGGRVERFVTEQTSGRIYDINSSYPARMVQPLPTRFRGARKSPSGKHWFASVCKVRVPDCHIPPLPYRTKDGPLGGKLLFPVGDWTGVYTCEELEALEECGGSWEPLETWEYEQEPWLSGLMNSWWAARASTNDSGVKLVTKLLMNSVSGKLIEHGEYETVSENPARATAASQVGASIRLYPMRAGITLYGISDKHNGSLRHAASAAAVLARARVQLWRGMRSASGEVAYCDTDSVFTAGTLEDTGSELGRFKLEAEYSSAEFLAPKLYAVELPDRLKIRAKGIRLPRGRDSRELWSRISFGLPLAWETHLSYKRGLTKGVLGYSRVIDSRRFVGALDKREFVGRESEPWRVKQGKPLLAK